MGDQTGAAVDSVLGLLSGAIKDESRLLGGIQGDMQFIKDEMDSMNGFLLHLNKTESEHDDQLRAWMKQVRDIANISQDCVVVYMNDIERLQVSSLFSKEFLWKLPRIIWNLKKLHRFATKIKELKVRVREVGERRQRYDVNVKSLEPRRKTATEQGGTAEDRREDFLDALLGPQRHRGPKEEEANRGSIVNVDKAIRKLPPGHYSAADCRMIRTIAKRCTGTVAKEMFLRALYAYPQGAKNDLEKLKKKMDQDEDNPDRRVMIYCYSKLSTDYKSCLQYLAAFQKEDRISRTSMVRRWLAEGLVARDPARSLEEAAEKCFRNLMFLGYICPVETGATGTVKSCNMDQTIKKFVDDISEDENFVRGNLPYHLKQQVAIREIAIGRQKQAPTAADMNQKGMLIISCGGKKIKDPLIDILRKIKLIEFYRLNVLDLGGFKGLTKDHLKIICKMRWLKYLSLRSTDIYELPKRKIEKLNLLETLDVRQTDVLVKGHIHLPKLKHLLAGRAYDYSRTRTTDKPLLPITTVPMPREMQDMEILSHVLVNDGNTDLLDLPKCIRKLGVLLPGRKTQITVRHLLLAVSKLSESLRSLSISLPSIKNQSVPFNMDMLDTELHPKSLESLHINGYLGNNGLPNWCHSLNKLSKVTLCETRLPAVQSLNILGKLQVLCCLRLRRNSFLESTLTFSAGDFSYLKFLWMEDTYIGCIEFQKFTAPKLERITWWSFDDSTTDVTNIFKTVMRGTSDLPMLKFVEFNPGKRCLNVSTTDKSTWFPILGRNFN